MLVVMAIALIVFGPKRMPEIGRQIGVFVRDLRKTLAGITDVVEDAGGEVRNVMRETAHSVASSPSDPPHGPVQVANTAKSAEHEWHDEASASTAAALRSPAADSGDGRDPR
jgi:Sec-independent protein translocase protein TatA